MAAPVSSPLHQLLKHQSVIVLDGAMGTELERHGVDLTGSKLWSSQLLIDNPSVVKQVHAAYLEAGADVITTATYQAHLDGFKAVGLDESPASDCIRLAVQLAAEARQQHLQEQGPLPAGGGSQVVDVALQLGSDGSQQGQQEPSGQQQQQQPTPGQQQPEKQPEQQQQQPEPPKQPAAQQQPGQLQRQQRQRPLIGFSAGSFGASLCDGSEFTGTYAQSMSRDQLAEWHLWRLRPILDNPEVDLICFETVPCLLEVQAICHLLRTHPGLAGAHAWVSCSCMDGQHTYHGEGFATEIVPELWQCEQVVGIGVNCTHPAHVPQLLAGAHDALVGLEAQRQQQEEQQQGQQQGQQQQGQQQPGQQQPSERQRGLASVAGVADGAPAGRRSAAPILLCYPNSGEAWDGEHRCWREHSARTAEPEEFAAAARTWVEAGARAVGGCCRTGPEHIQALRQALLAADE